jgi:hypothetical protein
MSYLERLLGLKVKVVLLMTFIYFKYWSISRTTTTNKCILSIGISLLLAKLGSSFGKDGY